ncbi:MAG: sulfatase-like hydrolase/transferase [Ectothiorhodospiraceae bacterium]|nr:sulfatase-like hydrolase/transferase [Chromatiales bacterium]MCP5156410.1 sulfatase-like hydrolase/transferase [Ectothiorhodospiraceae bacterium]
MSRRPNILFITSDQQRGDCYGFEGRPVRTPHLDMLASEGTRFAACITPNVVCQPSRASILTGLLPRTHGVADNGIDLPPEAAETGFAATLARGGYRTGFVGKAHFATSHTFARTGTPECRHSMQEYDESWFGPYMGFEHVELVVEGHNHWPPLEPPSGQHYERWYHGDGRGALKNELYATRLAPDVGAPQTWHSALPTAWHNSTWIGNQTIAYIERHADEPFCLWASFPDPHHPFDAPDPWSRMHDPDEVDLPVHRTLDLERRPWWHRASLENKPSIRQDLAAIRENYSRIKTIDDLHLRHVIANYFGMISLIDHNVGRILASLDALGLADDTIVVFSTDHGDWLGDHGLILKGPMHYEGLLRVGCIMRGPGVPAGQVVQDPVSTLDLAATFHDYAGVSPARELNSRSLRGLVEGRETRDFAYNEWALNASRCGVALELRTVRTRTHKMTVDLNSGAGELYHLAEDPHEMENLYEDPGHAAVRRELREMIEARPDDALSHPLSPVGMA